MQDENVKVMSPELLAQLALCGQARSFARNEVLVVEGAEADALYLLVSGELKVFTRDRKGRELVYNILQPGEFFGEMFLDGGPRSASVKAVVASRCVVVDRAALRGFMATYPEFAECLVHQLIARVRHATQLSKRLALHGVYERTVDLLEQVAVLEDEVYAVPLTLTQQEIADRVGATREMINHVMKKLTQDGLLARDETRRLVFNKSLPSRWEQGQA